MNWNERTVLITGAASGIGAALAEELAGEGADLALLDVAGDEVGNLADRLDGSTGTALGYTVDVTDVSQVNRAYERIRERLGTPDVVVANAGLGYTTPATDLDTTEFKQLMNVNVDGVVNTLQPALDGLFEEDKEGELVVVSSVAAFTTAKGGAAYCASKAAVLRFAEGLRYDLVDEPVSVTTIHPGWVETDMTRKYPEELRFMEIPVEQAAQTIRRGIESDRDRVIFPWPMKIFVGLLEWIPDRLLDMARSRAPLPTASEERD